MRRGELDVFLTRPAPVFLQVLGQVTHFQAVLSLIIYVGIFVWAALQLNLHIGLYEALILVEYVIFGTMVNSGIYAIFNFLNFWIVPGRGYCGAGADLPGVCEISVERLSGGDPGILYLSAAAGVCGPTIRPWPCSGRRLCRWN